MRDLHVRRPILTPFAVALVVLLPCALRAQNTALIPTPFQEARHEGFLTEMLGQN